MFPFPYPNHAPCRLTFSSLLPRLLNNPIALFSVYALCMHLYSSADPRPGAFPRATSYSCVVQVSLLLWPMLSPLRILQVFTPSLSAVTFLSLPTPIHDPIPSFYSCAARGYVQCIIPDPHHWAYTIDFLATLFFHSPLLNHIARVDLAGWFGWYCLS